MDRLISEQEVLDVIASWFESVEQQKILQGRIKAIPSAEPKTGHWINISNKDLHDYRTGNKLCFECSECRSQYTYKSNYCPNCGMVEPQESEEV